MEAWSGIKDKETGKIVYIYSPDTMSDFFLGKG